MWTLSASSVTRIESRWKSQHYSPWLRGVTMRWTKFYSWASYPAFGLRQAYLFNPRRDISGRISNFSKVDFWFRYTCQTSGIKPNLWENKNSIVKHELLHKKKNQKYFSWLFLCQTSFFRIKSFSQTVLTLFCAHHHHSHPTPLHLTLCLLMLNWWNERFFSRFQTALWVKSSLPKHLICDTAVPYLVWPRGKSVVLQHFVRISTSILVGKNEYSRFWKRKKFYSENFITDSFTRFFIFSDFSVCFPYFLPFSTKITHFFHIESDFELKGRKSWFWPAQHDFGPLKWFPVRSKHFPRLAFIFGHHIGA